MLGQIEDSGQHELLNGFCLIGAMGPSRTQAELRRVRRDQHHEFDQGDRRLSAVTAGRLRISMPAMEARLCRRTRLFVGSRDETRISLCPIQLQPVDLGRFKSRNVSFRRLRTCRRVGSGMQCAISESRTGMLQAQSRRQTSLGTAASFRPYQRDPRQDTIHVRLGAPLSELPKTAA